MADTLEQLKARFGDDILATHSFRGDDTALVKREALLAIATYLKNELQFNLLMDETAVDLLQMPVCETHPAVEGDRFEFVAHFYSLPRNLRVRIKSRCPENDARMPSLYSLYRSANYMEREIFDMYGVVMEGHPDLRRVLLYDEFQGYPLRKDYPISRQQPLIPMSLESVHSSSLDYKDLNTAETRNSPAAKAGEKEQSS
jgi:NADH-quinone oxidoreductase subunit C